jgi:hypothetical protein
MVVATLPSVNDSTVTDPGPPGDVPETIVPPVPTFAGADCGLATSAAAPASDPVASCALGKIRMVVVICRVPPSRWVYLADTPRCPFGSRSNGAALYACESETRFGSTGS